MYTGSETKAEKKKNKEKFVSGQTNLMIISNRSGAGIDGLQYRCNDVVIGELDWSPMVLKQLIARLRRYGQAFTVNAHYMICEEGSDPLMIDVLGVKASQAHAIMNPYMQPIAADNDNERMKRLAAQVIERNGLDPKQFEKSPEAGALAA
jgi:SNF2 family DNA or RNA helicase